MFNKNSKVLIKPKDLAKTMKGFVLDINPTNVGVNYTVQLNEGGIIKVTCIDYPIERSPVLENGEMVQFEIDTTVYSIVVCELKHMTEVVKSIAQVSFLCTVCGNLAERAKQ